MKIVAGKTHPAKIAKTMLHSQKTAAKNYVHRGYHAEALVGHQAWISSLNQRGK